MIVKTVEEAVIDDHKITFNIIRVYVEQEECHDDKGEKSPCKRHNSLQRLNSKILKGYALRKRAKSYRQLANLIEGTEDVKQKDRFKLVKKIIVSDSGPIFDSKAGLGTV